MYEEFFHAVFNAFNNANREGPENLNRLFSFISYFIENAPKTLDEVDKLPSNKSVIDRNSRAVQERLTEPSPHTENIEVKGSKNEYGLGVSTFGYTPVFNIYTRGKGENQIKGRYNTEPHPDFLEAISTPNKRNETNDPNETKRQKITRGFSLGGSRRRKYKKNKTKRRKHAYKYKKLTKRNCKKKYKTKKNNH